MQLVYRFHCIAATHMDLVVPYSMCSGLELFLRHFEDAHFKHSAAANRWCRAFELVRISSTLRTTSGFDYRPDGSSF